MPEIRRNYQALLDMEQEQALWKKFHVWNVGRTNGAHSGIVQKLKDIGHTEVDSPEDCDYLLGFCPVASRVGTDISEALDNKPPGKPVILVVMHHTHDCHHVVAKSSRQVNDPDVRLTVDCLFYDGKLLDCNLNEKMWADIMNHLGITQCSYLLTKIVNWIKKHPLIVALVIALIFVIILLVTPPQADKIEHAHVEPLNNSTSTNKTNV